MPVPLTHATSRRSGVRRHARQLLPPLAVLALVAVLELETPATLPMEPLATAAPVLAAVIADVWATAGIACLALALTVVLDIHAHTWGRPGQDVVVAALSTVCIVSVLASRLRRRREVELTHVRSVAETAQRALLRPLPSSVGRLNLAGAYLAAEAEAQIGGDFYEVLHTPFGVRLIIGDVRGKGLPAVGTTATLLGCFREAAYDEATLAGVAARLEETANRHIDRMYTDERFTERFATALLLEIPADEPIARMVHCGHPEPLVIRNGTVNHQPAAQPGAPIGLADLAGTQHAVQTLAFQPGDRMLLYTDGFIEARDRTGRFHALGPAVLRHAEQPLGRLVVGLRQDLLQHAGGHLDDDAALLAIERASARD